MDLYDDFDEIYAEEAIEVNEPEDGEQPSNQFDKLVGDLAKRQEKDARERKREAKPRFKYTERELIGSKGLVALRKSFEDFEVPAECKTPYASLAEVMERMELWAHRLCPSMTFDDFLIKTEQLGRKRPVKTYMTKLRMGMPLENGDFEEQNEEPDDEDAPAEKEPAKKKPKKAAKEYVPVHVH